MSIKVIKKDQVVNLLNKIAANYQLIAPMQEDNIVSFKPMAKADGVVLDYINSVLPPKDYFFPQTETMFNFDTRDNDIKITEPEGIKERVLFGVKHCDLQSIVALDKVFDREFKDTYYLDKRAKTTIVALSCTDIYPTCFCTSVGISPVKGEGSDLLLTDIGDVYLAEAFTDKGEKIISAYGEFFSDAAADAESKKNDLESKVLAKFVRQTSLDGVKEKLDKMFEHPYWDEVNKKCLNCGCCTYICPTCHCFDIVDYKKDGYTGERFRCWDSCMYADYTGMAHGNPRPTKKERVRNRFMHKLRYARERYDLDHCVGCGRCSRKCPVNLDIFTVINDIKEIKDVD